MNPGGESHLILQMRESRPTAEAQAGLDELVEAGIIKRETFNQFGGVRYTPLVSCFEHFKWLGSHTNDPECKIRLMEPIDAGRAALTEEKNRA
jgi:hypothetical protein